METSVSLDSQAGLAFSNLQIEYDSFMFGPITGTIAKGGVVALLGGNGSGKTTLISALMGFRSGCRGSVSWDGQAIDNTNRVDFLRHTGFMSDSAEDVIREMTPLEYWDYCALVRADGCRVKSGTFRQRARMLSEELMVSSQVTSLKHLSFGNRRKVQAIGALLHKPELLILDEPFTGLDFVSADALERTLLHAAKGGCTVLYSSHDVEGIVRLADRIMLIDAGRLVSDERVKDLEVKDLRSKMLRLIRDYDRRIS